MAGSKPATRLYVEAALAPGQTVGLDHGQAHFLRSVLRLGPGARLAVFNGRDGEWLAEIDALGKGWCPLALRSEERRVGKEWVSTSGYRWLRDHSKKKNTVLELQE